MSWLRICPLCIPRSTRRSTAVRTAAVDWLRDRHEAWRSHAAALQVWLEAKRASAGFEVIAAQVKAARDFLKGAIDSLREARLAPFAAHSQRIWEELRQESNVSLGGMKLAGTATHRRVAFPATVDGTATSAMAVMSQGELQALGLAVFLPRACADGEPVPVRHHRRPGAEHGSVQGRRSGAGALHARADASGGGVHARQPAAGGDPPSRHRGHHLGGRTAWRIGGRDP